MASKTHGARSIEITVGMMIGRQKMLRRTPGEVAGWWDCECQDCKKVASKWHSNLGKIKDGNTGCRCRPSKAHLVESRTTIKAGDRFGMLVATGRVRRSPYGSKQQKRTEAEFTCDCGGTGVWRVQANVQRKLTTSCGCKVATTPQGWNEPRWAMWRSARDRSRDRGTPFTITHEDIVIPDRCPVFGIPLIKGEGELIENSPTLDEIRPGEGYTSDNIWVISWRANKLKGDGTLAELQALVAALERKLAEEL